MFIAWMSEHSAEWAGSAMIPARESEREGAAEFPQAPIAEVAAAVGETAVAVVEDGQFPLALVAVALATLC